MKQDNGQGGGDDADGEARGQSWCTEGVLRMEFAGDTMGRGGRGEARGVYRHRAE